MALLDQAHIRRNRSEYEGGVDLEQSLVESVIRVVREIETKVRALPLPQ
jgi:hypothetical protein